MKQLLALIALLGSTTITFAQGQVIFANSAATSTLIYTNDGVSSGRVSGAGNYYFALYVAPSTVTTIDTPLLLDDPDWAFTGVYATNVAVAGRIFGWKVADMFGNYYAEIDGYPAGTLVSLAVVGWSANIGVTIYDLANFWHGYSLPAGLLLVGQSDIASIYLGNGADMVNYSIFGNGAGQVHGLTLYAVPEPSAFALTGLGAAALLFFRRPRRQKAEAAVWSSTAAATGCRNA